MCFCLSVLTQLLKYFHRLDTTLIDFTDMKCQRGDLSFIFNGEAAPSESFVVLDNEQKVYQRIHHEVSQSVIDRHSRISPINRIQSWLSAESGIRTAPNNCGWCLYTQQGNLKPVTAGRTTYLPLPISQCRAFWGNV